MIIFDVEANGLISNEARPFEDYPRLMEFGAIKLTTGLKEVAKLEFLCDPQEPIQKEVIKITGLTNSDLDGLPTFADFYDEVCDFFLGETVMLAHNISYDRGIMLGELGRLGRQYRFPWPKEHLCSVELTQHIKGHRLKLEELYEHVKKKKANQTHRAMGDVKLIKAILPWMKKEGLL